MSGRFQDFGFGRDPVRTPMVWNSEPHGGFTEGRPWLPLGPDGDVLNVSIQTNNPRSMLSLYRALVRLRRDSDVLLSGDLRLLAATEHVLAYERRLGDQRVVVALNMSGQARSLWVGNPAYQVLLSTYLDDPDLSKDVEIHLRADEGHDGKTYELAGDDAYTLSDFAAEISRQTGRTIPYKNMPVAEYAAALAGLACQRRSQGQSPAGTSTRRTGRFSTAAASPHRSSWRRRPQTQGRLHVCG